jgi:hypothetical protein
MAHFVCNRFLFPFARTPLRSLTWRIMQLVFICACFCLLAVCSVHVLKSPQFVPELARIGEVVSIGFGSVVEPYKKVLTEFSSSISSLLQGEVMGPGMGAMPLTWVIKKTIEQHPTPGISPHAHICLVRRGFMTVMPNDETIYPPTGEVIEFKMPPVATSWDQFVQMTATEKRSPHAVTA